MQEDTPPSFLSFALCLGTLCEQPLPLDTSHAGGGGCASVQGCEPHCYSFPCSPHANRNRAFKMQVSSSPSRHSKTPLHQQTKDRELTRTPLRQKVLLVPWMGLFAARGSAERTTTATLSVPLSLRRKHEAPQGAPALQDIPLLLSGCWSPPETLPTACQTAPRPKPCTRYKPCLPL